MVGVWNYLRGDNNNYRTALEYGYFLELQSIKSVQHLLRFTLKVIYATDNVKSLGGWGDPCICQKLNLAKTFCSKAQSQGNPRRFKRVPKLQ